MNDQGKKCKTNWQFARRKAIQWNGWTKGAAAGLEFLDGKVSETPKNNCCTDEDEMLGKRCQDCPGNSRGTMAARELKEY